MSINSLTEKEEDSGAPEDGGRYHIDTE